MQGLVLKNLVTEFDNKEKIGPVSLTLDKGKMLSLLGGSGSGKTTTLRMIAGLAPVASGQILFEGNEISHLPPQKRGVGMVFQNFGLFPHMTVRDNITFGLRMAKKPADFINQKFEWIAEKTRLLELSDRYSSQLSGGQKQRVALARTLVMDPDILLLDEPLSNLDANLREDMGRFIRGLQQDLNITTVFVTHDQEEALMLADEVAVMDGGEVLQQGSPEDIYKRPINEGVARFIGGSNIISGKIDSSGEFVFSAGKLKSKINNNVQNHKVMLRSEDLKLMQLDDFEIGCNAFKGTIQEARFKGGYFEYRVQAGDEDLIIRHMGEEKFPVGADVSISVAEKDVWPLNLN
ncbi:ATP-binding cassette domain-containing protein [Sneathiella sp. P13V-1]|uniref:ABC transporter ATP-binding protein n=1 Tax=Sneathiella sp. P13V-1 TaxID=2697366 RepID=UPI00187B8150|nr:ABC transporter ATP-binding protein [Sneathiella sp. P13V-1]MBE7637265.1 ATP-binding cassette domain-containing protein [Sneathiella sp. P13V-1]